MSRPEFYYMPVRCQEQLCIVGEPVNRIGFTRKLVSDLSPVQLEYVDTMLAAPTEKEARMVAFMSAYAKLLEAGGVPTYE